MQLQENHVKILIVDDHEITITGIRQLLSPFSRFEIVGQAENGLSVYRLCQETSPDLILLDLGLPGMDGLDVIKQLKSRWPTIKILVITASNEECKAGKAFTAGANGYVLKKSSQQVLMGAIQQVSAGKTFIDQALNQNQINSTPQNHVKEIPHLTTRERQTLKLISEGCRNRDMAEQLAISLKTVETHRQNLMRKLDAHGIAELVHWARRIGLS